MKRTQDSNETVRLLPANAARRFSLLGAVIVGSIALGIVFYREPFRFLAYPLSDLGATVSEHGFPNRVSNVFFDLGMIVGGLIMLTIARGLKSGAMPHREPKRVLSLVAALGFFVITFPYNINDTIHMIGGAALIGGLWGLTVLLLFELRQLIGKGRFWIMQILLQGTILPYALLVALDIPIKQAFQKPAVLALIITLPLALAQQRSGRRMVATLDQNGVSFATSANWPTKG